MATTAEKLEEVDRAISNVLSGGQSYQIGSRRLERASLSELREMQKELHAEAEAGTDQGLFDNTYLGYFDGR